MNNVGFWAWVSSTFDNNPHQIFVKFDTAKTYTMEISARSKGHGLDKFSLFRMGKNQVTDSNPLSDVTCQ